jgi:hypothetical protein
MTLGQSRCKSSTNSETVQARVVKSHHCPAPGLNTLCGERGLRSIAAGAVEDRL